VIAVFAIGSNLGQLAADVYHKQASLFDHQEKYANSVFSYEEALVLAPTQDYYALYLGRAYLEVARQAPFRSIGRQG